MRSFRVAISVCAGGIVLVWAFGVAGLGEPYDLCPGVPMVEGSGLRTDFTLWPPGTVVCEYTSPSGAVTTTNDFPGRDWASILLFALGMGCFTLAATLPRKRWRFLYASVVLTIGAMAVFFIAPAAAALIAAALAPLLLLLRPGRRRPATGRSLRWR